MKRIPNVSDGLTMVMERINDGGMYRSACQNVVKWQEALLGDGAHMVRILELDELYNREVSILEAMAFAHGERRQGGISLSEPTIALVRMKRNNSLWPTVILPSFNRVPWPVQLEVLTHGRRFALEDHGVLDTDDIQAVQRFVRQVSQPGYLTVVAEDCELNEPFFTEFKNTANELVDVALGKLGAVPFHIPHRYREEVDNRAEALENINPRHLTVLNTGGSDFYQAGQDFIDGIAHQSRILAFAGDGIDLTLNETVVPLIVFAEREIKTAEDKEYHDLVVHRLLSYDIKLIEERFAKLSAGLAFVPKMTDELFSSVVERFVDLGYMPVIVPIGDTRSRRGYIIQQFSERGFGFCRYII